jgi:hypothetical protein
MESTRQKVQERSKLTRKRSHHKYRRQRQAQQSTSMGHRMSRFSTMTGRGCMLVRLTQNNLYEGPHCFSFMSSLRFLASLYQWSAHMLDQDQRLDHTLVYFGSRYTYPLLSPFTSLTVTSRPAKSRAVTASKPTSNRTSDHSNNA